MRYNGVIECKFYNEPGDETDAWLADITLISNHLSLDDLHPLQYYFACYDEDCLRVSEDNVQIGPLSSLDHLMAICYQFSVYLKNLVELKKEYGDHPVFWNLDDIMIWRDMSERSLRRQSV